MAVATETNMAVVVTETNMVVAMETNMVVVVTETNMVAVAMETNMVGEDGEGEINEVKVITIVHNKADINLSLIHI